MNREPICKRCFGKVITAQKPAAQTKYERFNLISVEMRFSIFHNLKSVDFVGIW